MEHPELLETLSAYLLSLFTLTLKHVPHILRWAASRVLSTVRLAMFGQLFTAFNALQVSYFLQINFLVHVPTQSSITFAEIFLRIANLPKSTKSRDLLSAQAVTLKKD
jgi:hypothetical protein